MKIITKNAEKLLYETLERYCEEKPTHRCLHVKFSALNLDMSHELEALYQNVTAFIDDPACEIFICADYDIFILTRFITVKKAQEFLAHLFPKLWPVPLKGLANLFEIGISWRPLQKICQEKNENLAFLTAATKQSPAEDIAPAPEAPPYDQVKPYLENPASHTIAERRISRSSQEVLVVEDDPFSQRLIKNSLKDKCALTICDTGVDAITNYIVKAPDVLFLDIMLPDTDGHQILQDVMRLDPQAYVIMFSGNGDRQNVLKAIELGAKGFIGKPFSQDKVYQYIDKSPHVRLKTKTRAPLPPAQHSETVLTE